MQNDQSKNGQPVSVGSTGGSAARALHALNLMQSVALLPDGSHPRNVLREYIAGPVCENCREPASRITEDGVRLCAECYTVCPSEEPTEDEKHAIRHRVMLAESALTRAKQAVIDAEIELNVARAIAAEVLSPNTRNLPADE